MPITGGLIVANHSNVAVKITYYGQPDVVLNPGGQHAYEGTFPVAGLSILPASYNSGAPTIKSVYLNANGHPLTLTVN